MQLGHSGLKISFGGKLRLMLSAQSWQPYSEAQRSISWFAWHNTEENCAAFEAH